MQAAKQRFFEEGDKLLKSITQWSNTSPDEKAIEEKIVSFAKICFNDDTANDNVKNIVLRGQDLQFGIECNALFADAKNYNDQETFNKLFKKYMGTSSHLKMKSPEILNDISKFCNRLLLLQKIILQGSDKLTPDEVTLVKGYPIMKMLFEIKEKQEEKLTYDMIANTF